LWFFSSIYVGYRMYQTGNGMSVWSSTPLSGFFQQGVDEAVLDACAAVRAARWCSCTSSSRGDKNIDSVTPELELSAILPDHVAGGLYLLPSMDRQLLAEGDGNWHQTVLRRYNPHAEPHQVVLCMHSHHLAVWTSQLRFCDELAFAFARGISLMHVFAVVGPS